MSTHHIPRVLPFHPLLRCSFSSPPPVHVDLYRYFPTLFQFWPFSSLWNIRITRERKREGGGGVSFGFCSLRSGRNVDIAEISVKFELEEWESKGGGIVIFRPCSFPPKLTSQGSRIYFSFYTENPTWRFFFFADRIVPILCSSIINSITRGSKFVFVDVWKFLSLLIGFEATANFLR